MELLKQEGYVGRIKYRSPVHEEREYYIARTTKASGMTPYVTKSVVERNVLSDVRRLERDGGPYDPPCIILKAEVLKIDFVVLEATEINP